MARPDGPYVCAYAWAYVYVAVRCVAVVGPACECVYWPAGARSLLSAVARHPRSHMVLWAACMQIVMGLYARMQARLCAYLSSYMYRIVFRFRQDSYPPGSWLGMAFYRYLVYIILGQYL